MKLGILCNSKLSLPSIHTLVNLGHSIVIGMPEERGVDDYEIEGFANQFQIQVTRFQKQKLTEELIHWKIFSELEVIFVITFPHILAADLITNIKIDIVNFHFAPLPNYKGAQPAFWMIKNGEQKGGIAAHLITKEIDGGPIVHFEPYSLSENETYNSYMTKMSYLNNKVVQQVLEKVKNSQFHKQLKPQSKSNGVYYKKPQFDDVRIDWQKMTAVDIERLCRACNQWNKGALTSINNFPVKIIEVKIINSNSKNEQPGSIFKNTETKEVTIATFDNKQLIIKIAYTEDLGFFSNNKLSELGIQAGARLV